MEKHLHFYAYIYLFTLRSTVLFGLNGKIITKERLNKGQMFLRRKYMYCAFNSLTVNTPCTSQFTTMPRSDVYKKMLFLYVRCRLELFSY
jgi:hypothetical protein